MTPSQTNEATVRAEARAMKFILGGGTGGETSCRHKAVVETGSDGSKLGVRPPASGPEGGHGRQADTLEHGYSRRVVNTE